MSYLEVRDVRGTDLVEVRFTTPSPSLSAFLAAAHTQAYIEANEEARLATDSTAKSFLDSQLRESRQRVERAEAALRRFATEHPNVAVNQEQKVVGAEDPRALESAHQSRGHARHDAEPLRVPDQRRAATRSSYFLDKPGVQKLHLALLDLRAERAALEAAPRPEPPADGRAARVSEIEVEQPAPAEVQHEVAAVRARYDAARGRETALREKLAQPRGLGDRAQRSRRALRPPEERRRDA